MLVLKLVWGAEDPREADGGPVAGRRFLLRQYATEPDGPNERERYVER